MRAVLDTNVLISGLLWRGAPHECLLLAEAGLYELVLAESIFEELRDKLIHKFGNAAEETDEILIGLRRCAALVTLTGRSGWVSADPHDDKFIESALLGHADAIVSGDHHLLDLSAGRRRSDSDPSAVPATIGQRSGLRNPECRTVGPRRRPSRSDDGMCGDDDTHSWAGDGVAMVQSSLCDEMVWRDCQAWIETNGDLRQVSVATRGAGNARFRNGRRGA